MSAKRVFVVTGANKGIGYGIIKLLAEKVSTGIIYLTARNETLGKESLSKVINELGDKRNSEIRFHQLDITDRGSAKSFAKYLEDQHNGFDVLVNNAGFAFKNSATESAEEQARVTIDINYYATKQLCDILLPLIRENGRVVNVCSSMGIMTGRYSNEWIEKIANPQLKTQDLDEFINAYKKACVENNRRENGFPESAYCVSKCALIALSIIQSKELAARKIIVNGCCPGFVDTDMSSHKGHLTIEQGADTPVYLATFEGTEPNGKFVYLREPVNWAETNPTSL